MPSLPERISSLRRLAPAGTDGNGEFWEGFFDFCQEAVDKMADLEESQEDLSMYLETIDEDLSRLEGQLYGAEEEEEDEEPLLDLVCPNCHHQFQLPEIRK